MTNTKYGFKLLICATVLAGTAMLAGCGSSEKVSKTTTTEQTTTSSPAAPTTSSSTTTTTHRSDE